MINGLDDYDIVRFWFEGTDKIKAGWMYKLVKIKK